MNHCLAAKLLHNVREKYNQALQVTQESTDHSIFDLSTILYSMSYVFLDSTVDVTYDMSFYLRRN